MNKLSDEKISSILKLYNEGLHSRIIAEKLEIGRCTVERYIKASGFTPHPGKQYVRRNEIIKLVPEILRLHDGGYTAENIAKALNIPKSTITNKFREIGLTPNGKKYPLEIINNFATCHYCLREQPLELFRFFKSSNSYSSCCRSCQYLKKHHKQSTDILSYLRCLVTGSKSRAKDRKVLHEIDAEYLLNVYKIQNGVCFYTHHDLPFARGKGHNPSSLSIDRIIPEKGYIAGNVVLCQKRINIIKNDFSIEEMKLWMPSWYDQIMAGYKSGLLY